MSTRPEALRLADALDAYHTAAHHKQAAVELRRLHLVNAELLEALIVARQAAIDWFNDSWGFRPETHEHPDWLIQSDAAIAKATGAT